MKKEKTIKTIISVFVSLILLCGSGLLVYYLYKLKGIEDFYRYLTMAFVAFVNIVFINGMRYSVKNTKRIRYVVVTILSLIIGGALGVLGYFIQAIYSRLDNFNKTTYEYSTALITFKEKFKDKETLNKGKIGIISNEYDIEGYIIAQEILEKEGITSELAKYDEAEDLIYALYNDRVDAVFVSADYEGMFSTTDEFEDIAEKAIEVKKLTKTYTEEEIVEIESQAEGYVPEETPTKSLTEPFTILLLGVDSTASKLNKNAAFNGDTIMLITFNPNTMSATMFSVPRDTYVPVTCSGNRYKKINSAAYGGSKCMVNTLEQWTGIDIDYYVKINFKGVVDLVNALGGIDVDVPMKFCEQNSKRQFGNKKICLNKGFQHLDGEAALALARHRKTLLLGDFQRGQNQQIVVEGMMNSVKNLRSANDVLDVLDAVSMNIDTNIKTEEILSLYNVAKDMMFSDDTNMINIQKTFLRGYDMYVWAGSMNTYSFHNWNGSLKEIVSAMKVNLELEKEKPVKELHFNLGTEYERYIAGDRQFSETKRAKVPDFTGKSYSYAKSWLEKQGISVTAKTISCSHEKYNAKYGEGIVVHQSTHKNALALNVSSTTLYLNPSCATNTPQETPVTPPTEDNGTDTGNNNTGTETTPTTPETGGNEGSGTPETGGTENQE